jgi:hypothetical protein
VEKLAQNGHPRVDVRIFGDFRHFSSKKLAFFSKTNVMIIFLQKLHGSSLSKKRQFFRHFFGEKK